MIHAGAREFRERAARYFAGNDVVAIEQDGKVVGYYIPAPKRDEKEVRRAIAESQEAVARVMEETGLSEDELARIFDLNEPYP